MLEAVLPPLDSAALLTRVSAGVAEVEHAEVPPPVPAGLARVCVAIEHVVPKHSDAHSDGHDAESAQLARRLLLRGERPPRASVPRHDQCLPW